MNVKRVLLILLGFTIVMVSVLILILLVNSPGKIPKLADASGQPITDSINEKKFMTINGVRQGMFIRGEDKTKPVLLFLHGGPGSPEFAMSQSWETQERL